MADCTRSTPSRTDIAVLRSPDFELIDLVDALVAAVDASRTAEIDQLRIALEPFGGAYLLDSELRLNATASLNEECICGGEGL